MAPLPPALPGCSRSGVNGASKPFTQHVNARSCFSMRSSAWAAAQPACVAAAAAAALLPSVAPAAELVAVAADDGAVGRLRVSLPAGAAARAGAAGFRDTEDGTACYIATKQNYVHFGA